MRFLRRLAKASDDPEVIVDRIALDEVLDELKTLKCEHKKVINERDAALAELGRMIANRSTEPGTNPRYYQSQVNSTHKILDPKWECRGLSVVGVAKHVIQQRDKAIDEKNAAYSERNELVVALAKMFPSFLARHPSEDLTWDYDWRWIVFINIPSGQMTWHIHDSERHMFHFLREEKNVWDGHDTEEKYKRLEQLIPWNSIDLKRTPAL